MPEKKYLVPEPLIPAVDWITRLGRETNAFDVKSVVQSTKDEFAWDHSVTISLKAPNHGKVELLVETKSQLTPKSADSILERRRWGPPHGVHLVCCPFISPRVAERLQEGQVSYIDRAGNCHLAAPGLFLHIAGRPNRSTTRSNRIDPFSKKSSRIIRTLLSQPKAEWQVQQLAKEAKVSLGLASKVKQALVEEAYLEERGRLLHLRDPGKLLHNWSKAYRPHATPLHIFTMCKAPQSEKRIAEWCDQHDTPYALTQLAAAWRYSPMVRYDKSVLYFDKATAIAGKLSELFSFIDAREVDTGANCTLWLTDDPAVFEGAKNCDGVNVVSPIQLYLDLKSLPGRGEEAARELYEKELRKLFGQTADESRLGDTK
ncbi:hypothetical protein ETAA8_46540 [Anatilimnocola aggregata]|uniref:Uncharacterized protein n=2 Tax=Anatilimnocola aggregata TaxID=2528021 RepID=A0A517YH25_9BACT|nr:hypothetical protein ETAA8_46540 [Anatilimnocola aggregata]